MTAAIAAAAGCKGPDPSSFACTSSAECPGDYHCDLGTATSTGSLKCVSGAPTPRTLTADATKFLLSKHPESDGSTRTTVLAKIGAVTSTPDFVGVRVFASQSGRDLANAAVAADGSVLEFQLPTATAQVSLRVQDDSGRSIPVTGYPEEVELSFVGKEVAGTTNAAAAFDVTNSNDALFAPATWIASGPGPGGSPQEFSTASYALIAYTDYQSASTTSPLVPTSNTPVGWQSIQQFPTTALPGGGPSARTGVGLASTGGGFFLFGGKDSASPANPVDPQGSLWQYDSFLGWTFTPAPAGPLPSSRSGAAAGRSATGGTCFLNGFTPPCTIDDLQTVVVGGAGATGTLTNEVQLFHHTRTFTNFSVPPTITTNWQLVGTIPAGISPPNAGMQHAAGFVPFNAVVGGNNTSQIYAGGMMIYGQAVTPASSGTVGCVLFGAAPQSPVVGSPAQIVPIQAAAASCVGAPSAFDQTTGGIGFRTGATLVADTQNPTNFYLFGGRKTTGATTTALQNDIWKATVTCTAVAPAACTTTTTWTLVSGGGVPPNFPTPRAGAGGAIWINGRLAIHGGTDAGGNLGDLWEFDLLGANTWRLVTQDTTAGVVSPPVRTGFAMTGDSQHIYTFGGAVSGNLTDQAWLGGHESAAKLLVKLPFNLPVIGQATNVKLTLDALGISGSEQAFVWDGTNWRFLGGWDFTSATPHINATTSGSATTLLQPDGNVYLLFIQANRAQVGFGTGFFSPVSIDRLKVTVDFQ